MISLAYRIVRAQDVEPGSRMATNKGRLTVVEVTKVSDGVRITGVPEKPMPRSNRRLVVRLKRDEDALVLANEEEMVAIEGAVLAAVAKAKSDKMQVEADRVLITIDSGPDHWTIPLHGAATQVGPVAVARSARGEDPDDDDIPG